MTPAPRHVVLVHGFLDGPSVFGPLARHLGARGWHTHAVRLPRTGHGGVERLAGLLCACIDAEVPGDAPTSLVAFSLGGLVARYAVQRLGLPRVRHLVTIATPHHGTALARVLPGITGRQMRPGSPFLAGLNADAHALAPLNPLSVWTPYDLTIRPPSSAVLPVGTSLRVPVLQHTLLLWSPRVHAAVAASLDAHHPAHP